MLCCKCKKNLAVVYVSRIDENGKTVNEGYCLTCAKELNLGPVNDIMNKMGINPEEMDGLNREMSALIEEMGDEFNPEDGFGATQSGGDIDDEFDEDGEENMSRSMQKNPFELMNKLFSAGKPTDDGGAKENKTEKKEKLDGGKRKRKNILTPMP